MVIYQPLKGYCYNSDTIFFYDFLKEFPLKGDILDVGTGSGILALLVARDFKKVKVSAIELQDHFFNYAKINAKANNLKIEVLKGDFLTFQFGKKFDFLISNPPFYHKNVLRSQDATLDKARYSGFLPLEEFIKKANTLLKPRGGLFFCYDAKQIMDIIAILKEKKFNLEALKFVHPNRFKEASLVMVFAKKSSKSLCKTLPPLTVFEGEKYALTTEEIFKKVGVHSIKCQL
ncbi:MAG: methyltransferase [Epsilonproteobacteria bacterium]|nr:methyltransferase [Campylobacterota bacterium]